MNHSSPFPITHRRSHKLTKAEREAEAARQRGYQITLEFRTHRGGLRWEDTPIDGTYTLDERDAHITANHIAQYLADREGEEVRWNVAGSLQGHFRQPEGGTHEFARAVLGPQAEAKPLNQFTLAEAFQIAQASGYNGRVLLLAGPDGKVIRTWNIDLFDLWIADIEFMRGLRTAAGQGANPPGRAGG